MNSKITIIVTFCLLFFYTNQLTAKTVSATSGHRLTKASNPNLPRIKQVISQTLNDSTVPFSGTLILLHQGKPILEVSEGKDINSQSEFVIASLSKQITATLTLRAVDEGKVVLSAPIHQYLPNTDFHSSITVHQLLSHTSGVSASGKANLFTPGSQFQYSNLGYSLLGQILEKVYQQSFSEQVASFAKEFGLKALSANTGKLKQLQLKHPKLAFGQHETKTWQASTLEIDEALLPAGGMVASSNNFAKFQQLLHSGQLISPASYALMTQAHAHYQYMWPNMGYGYGLRINHTDGLKEYSHMGYLPGYMSLSLHYPQTDIDLVMLENLSLSLNDFTRAFALQTQLRNNLRNQLLSSTN